MPEDLSERNDDAAALTARLLRQVRRLEIRARHMAEDLFAGSYRSVFKGAGLEFSEVRRYYPGDAISNIDWNVTARAGYPHVKQHMDERLLTVVLVVDVSGSVQYGSLDRRKRDVAAEVGGLLAFSAIRNHDNVGLMMFTTSVEKYLAPDSGRTQGLRVIRELLHHEAEGRGTDIAGALEFVSRVLTRRAIVFLISDFHDEDFWRPMSVAAKRHDLIAVRLVDPRERTLPDVGLVELVDAETDRHLVLDTGSEDYRRTLETLLEERRRKQNQQMARCGVDVIEVPTDGSPIDPLARFFERRRRRLR